MSKKATVAPAARVTLPLPATHQYAATIATCTQQVATVLANPDIANHPEVTTAANNVLAQATTMSQTVTALGNAHANVVTLEGKRGQEAVVLRFLHTNLEALLNVAAGGNKQAAVAWGGKLATRTITAATTAAPLDATAAPTKVVGAVLVKCKAERGVVCYLFQMGSDPAHPETWPQPAIVGGSKYTATGLTAGQKVYFRIAIVRRGNVQSAWSDVIAVTAR